MTAGVSATDIALGDFYTCAIEAGGGVKCWGANEKGQLGIGSTADQSSPLSVPGAWGEACIRPHEHACLTVYMYQ